MTDDLDTLRPEVREALNRQDRQKKCDEYCPVCADRKTIRVELLRLAGSLTARQTIDAISRAERAEAELAALKARIAGSRHAFLGPNMDRITFLADEIGPSGKYALVKVED